MYDKELNRLKSIWNGMIVESRNGNKNRVLIIVDIQPEYGKHMGFSIGEFCEWLNESYMNYSDIILFWNGPELGMSSREDITSWYSENGLSDAVIEFIKWHDKSYAYFRYCIDGGEAFDDTVRLVRYMYKHKINDSRDIDSEMWDDIVHGENLGSSRELLEFADDCIHIPDLMGILDRISGSIYVCGGGRDECLAEVEIGLSALGKKYGHIDRWIY